jgi:hypothetical protein
VALGAANCSTCIFPPPATVLPTTLALFAPNVTANGAALVSKVSA